MSRFAAPPGNQQPRPSPPAPVGAAAYPALVDPDDLRRIIDERTRGWAPEQRDALVQRLRREATRSRLARQHGSAGRLARSIDLGTKQTPALDVIDRELEWALHTRNAKLVITVPPQEGKSTRISVWGSLRALQLDPERRIVVASYNADLAREHARTARNFVVENGSAARDPLTGVPLPDKLGFALAKDVSGAGHWSIEGHRGGMYAVGVEGGLTGRAADLMIVDDPFSGQKEADSITMRENVWKWWQSTSVTRLAPGAPTIIVQTRWHEDDLAGRVLREDQGRIDAGEDPWWRWVNIPALAEAKVPDALGREPGTYLVSARGRTPDDWQRTRSSVGERTWFALYEGIPTPLTGGLFSREWFDRHRTSESPRLNLKLVVVDPAESGQNDEAGIVAGGLTADGRVALTHDVSGHYTSDQWARRAVVLALETGAQELVFEAYTAETTYKRVIRRAWADVALEAQALRTAGGDLAKAAAALALVTTYLTVDPDDEQAAASALVETSERAVEAVKRLREHAQLVVPDVRQPPFRIHPIRGAGDKTARSAGLRQAASTGRAFIVGSLPVFEEQARTWQQGQKSPDRMDAMVHLYERTVELAGQTSTIVAPGPRQATAPNSMAGRLSAQMPTSLRP